MILKLTMEECTLVNDIIVAHWTPPQNIHPIWENVASKQIKECLVKIRLATHTSDGPRFSLFLWKAVTDVFNLPVQDFIRYKCFLFRITTKIGKKHSQMHTDPKNALRASQEVLLLPRNCSSSYCEKQYDWYMQFLTPVSHLISSGLSISTRDPRPNCNRG